MVEESLYKAFIGEGNPRFSQSAWASRHWGADWLLRENGKQRSRMLFLLQFQFRDQSSSPR
ncbi:MAG: hypothetical protein D3909_19775 [Candidatus Electrothrix sp. ATG1]|nr:hypothetical protein [Candidatus Electrothrix sp. ATG1]